ncbi:Gfo/Idh/MocA family oxidoreductase [bacterium]|nr:Gfo/Idh/MocA family oxidoreductase [bacterium]
MNTVKMGIIGCGSIQRRHLAAILKDVPSIQIVAICDTNEEKLNGLGDRYNIKQRYANYKELIAREDVEAVDIAVYPEEVKCELVKEIAKAGKHIFVEKPMAISVKEAEEIAKIVRESKIKFQVAFNRRFFPLYVKAKEIMRDEEFGEFAGLNAYLGWSGKLYLDHFSGEGWQRERWEYEIVDQGIHIIDLVQYFGGKVDKVYVQNQKTDKGMSLSISMHYRNGAVGTLFLTSFARGRYTGRMEIQSTNYNTIILEHARELLWISPGLEKHWTSGITYGSLQSYAAEFKHFADCVLNDKSPSPGLDCGLDSVCLYEAIIKSISTGKIVEIK